MNNYATRSHLITLSARASTFGGIVRPICLAAFKLITSSNLVGCSTGKSAGFAPPQILSTYMAARRSSQKYLRRRTELPRLLDSVRFHTPRARGSLPRVLLSVVDKRP